jgi:hypothetical protein
MFHKNTKILESGCFTGKRVDGTNSVGPKRAILEVQKWTITLSVTPEWVSPTLYKKIQFPKHVTFETTDEGHVQKPSNPTSSISQQDYNTFQQQLPPETYPNAGSNAFITAL